MPDRTTDRPDEALLARIREEIRAEHPYVVGKPPETRVKLNQNESPYDLPPSLKAALAEAFMATPFNRYPSEQPERLRAALSQSLGHPESGILVGNGSNELTYTLGQVFVRPGAPVVLPRPMFSLYEKVVRMAGGEVVGVAPREDLHFDVDAIVRAVEERDPALTVLTTPNNPTGLALSLGDIERVLRAARGFVVVDEAYVEFTRERSAFEVLGRYPNLLLMRTLSKAFGLAGLRLGYMVGHPEIVTELMKARLPFMVDAVSESVGVALVRDAALRAERVAAMAAECQRLTEALETMPGVEVVPSQANFVLFRPASTDSKAVLRGLAERGVLIRDMSGYPELPGFLRVNAGTREETQTFLSALHELLGAHSGSPDAR